MSTGLSLSLTYIVKATWNKPLSESEVEQTRSIFLSDCEGMHKMQSSRRAQSASQACWRGGAHSWGNLCGSRKSWWRPSSRCEAQCQALRAFCYPWWATQENLDALCTGWLKLTWLKNHTMLPHGRAVCHATSWFGRAACPAMFWYVWPIIMIYMFFSQDKHVLLSRQHHITKLITFRRHSRSEPKS